MKELILYSTMIHVGSVFLSMLVVLLLFLVFVMENDYILLTRKYEKYSLFYFFFLSVMIFTGIVLFTVLGFEWMFKIVLMILASIYMIYTSIKLHLIFKSSRIYDIESQRVLKNYAIKKYFSDFFILVVVGFISYAIHI